MTLAKQHDCLPTNLTCTCPVESIVLSCAIEKCSVKDLLLTQKHFAVACKAPVLNSGPTTKGVSWSLFSIAVLAIALRFVARSPSLLGGPGYGWHDWTMLVMLVPMIAQQISVVIGMDRHPRNQIARRKLLTVLSSCPGWARAGYVDACSRVVQHNRYLPGTVLPGPCILCCTC